MKSAIFRIHGRKFNPCSPSKGSGLIMSATLEPPAAAVARADPADRLSDYLEALRYYLLLPNTTIDRILFVDNSNSNLLPLIELSKEIQHDKSVEFISFNGNDHPHQFGKAYGEFKLLDYGLENTTLFSPDDIIWKTTGRLKFLNLTEMINTTKQLNFDILCDLHNIPWVGSGKFQNHRNMDLRIFAFRPRAYNELFRNLWRTHSVGLDAEFMYYKILQPNNNIHVVPRFPLQAQLQGISGRHLRDYGSKLQRTKDTVRSAARKIMPWLWL